MSERPHHLVHQEANGFGTKARTFASRHWVKALSVVPLSGDIVQQVFIPRLDAGVGEILTLGGLVTFDRMKAAKRKRAQRDASQVLGRRSTRWFDVSKVNEGAKILEENLNLVFPEGKRPKQIDVNGKNRVISVLKHPRVTKFERAGVLYDKEFNTVFNINGDVEDMLIANLKAYMDTTNPNFITMQQDYDRAVISLSEGRAALDFDVEKYAIFTLFREGFSRFMAIKTFDDELSSFGSPDEDKPIEPFRELQLEQKSYRDISDYIASLKNKFHNKPKLFHRKFQESLSADAFFSVVTLTKNVMNILHANEMTPAQIIEVLVKFPPNSLEELANPILYLQNRFDIMGN